MSKGPDSAGRGRRDSADQQRDRNVYRYLLSLTDLGISGRSATPNETSIAKQWGVEENRIFIRRMLRSVLHEEFYSRSSDKEPPPVPGLTLAKLVSILTSLQQFQIERQKDGEVSSTVCTITRANKLRALRLFFRLSPEERQQLSLKAHPQAAILQQLTDRITDPSLGTSQEIVTSLYDYFLQQTGDGLSEILSERKDSSGRPAAPAFINSLLEQYTEQFFPGLSGVEKAARNKKFIEKVKREINRIRLQTGIEQADSFIEKDDSKAEDGGISGYLTTSFTRRLIHSVVDNELLTDEFPVYIKYFEIQRIKPLPLYVKQENENIGVLNPFLLKGDSEADDVQGLERQFAYQITVHFYIKLPADYRPKFEDLSIINTISGIKRLEFSEKVVGIGSPIAQIITAINRVLLWDIPLLKEYSPIAEGVYIKDEVVGGRQNSPVWSQCTVRLHKKQDISQAILQDEACDDVAGHIESASADFCGFDLLETAAKAALHSRLRLIKQILSNQPGVTAKDYIQQLCCHVEELTALNRAKQYLNYYPFSLRAMEGFLEETIFKDHYRKRLKDSFDFEEKIPGAPWSVVALNAQLEIAEANLKEGLLHIGRKYLEVIKPYFEGDDQDTIGDLLLTRYHLCWFRYYYLSDLEDEICATPDRYVAVRSAEDELDEAEIRLKNLLERYEKLDELSQSNLHPHFFLLSRIYAHRAKLFIFFSKYTRRLEPWETLLEPVRLLEKSKIYAARDGSPALYAQWSAYQGWCYIMLAYLGSQTSSAHPAFSREACLQWAQRLMNHAKVCYSATGKICYQQIKDAGGATTPHSVEPTCSTGKLTRPVSSQKYYQKYGSTFVQVMPLIREIGKDGPQTVGQTYQEANHVISLDISLLKVPGKDESSSVYLFGMQSSILLFVQGMISLCWDYEDAQTMLKDIRHKALRLFIYCSAIASDGTERNYQNSPADAVSDALVLDRAFPKIKENTSKEDPDHLDHGDSLLRCLYPHRLTQFADLGKIFTVVCKLILLISAEPFKKYLTSKKPGKEIDKYTSETIVSVRQLIKELRHNDQFPFDKSHSCEQKRYNGHLAEHYVQFEKYIEQLITNLMSKQLSCSEPVQFRNLIVTDTFRLIRGDIDVTPP